MKLLYLANNRIPTEKAHGVQIMEMCQAFALQGEVELVLPRRFNAIKEDPFVHFGINKTFKITHLPCIDLIPLNIGNFGFWVQAVSFLAVAKIYSLFRKYDILYTREKMAGFFFRDFVLEIHALPPKIKKINKKIWHKARALIVKTPYIEKSLITAGISGKKVLVMPNGVDLKKFAINATKDEARRKLGLPMDAKIVLYTGSFFLHDWKGVDVLLESAKNFGMDTIFLLVGGTKAEIVGVRMRYGQENIILEERRGHDQMPYYLRAADTLVLPNKANNTESQLYTSPIKLFEYMASGRPIVSSDLPSIRGILNEQNSFLVQPDSVYALTYGIKQALAGDGRGDAIAKKAVEDVQEYTWENDAKRIIEFLSRHV